MTSLGTISSAPLLRKGTQGSECVRETTNVPRGIGHVPTTQVPVSDGTEALILITRCWNAVTNGVLSIWRVCSGVTMWVWDCMSSPFRCRIITVAERLLTFKQLVEDVNACLRVNGIDGWAKKESKPLEAQLRVAYDALPAPLQRELNDQRQNPLHQFGKEVSVLDVLVRLSNKISIPDLIDAIYQKLPSVQWGNFESELVRGSTDKGTVATLQGMLEIVTSDLEPDVTEEMLNARILAVFDGLSDFIKQLIDEKIRQPLLYGEIEGIVSSGGERCLKINEQMVSLADPKFTSLVLKTMPRSLRVQRAVSRVNIDFILNREGAKRDSP